MIKTTKIPGLYLALTGGYLKSILNKWHGCIGN